MVYSPQEADTACPAPFKDTQIDAGSWELMYSHECTFNPDAFKKVMSNLIRNPNINSSWLFRADIIYDSDDKKQSSYPVQGSQPVTREISDAALQRTLVRTLIPRNTSRDAPMDQTCTFHQTASQDGTVKSLVLYVPHAASVGELPFYHPKVRGIAHLHEWDSSTSRGRISVSFLPFPAVGLEDKKIRRTAYHLLEVLHKHGQGAAEGYVKRVHHDVIVPQQGFQNRYQILKDKHARALCRTWAESTDPSKHVFEDLGIAAFLIELWADMYKDQDFPGFVDIGCGNGLLVYLLQQEGFSGWGFDARERKSWTQYNSTSALSICGSSLEQRLLLPSVVPRREEMSVGTGSQFDYQSIQDGRFPAGTFIISNHADELTPWTPILAAISSCPFMMIPCCSHSLTGERRRPPPPRDRSKSKSSYSSLVDWVTQIAEDCGWNVETEMLRIPSTRNTCLLGRKQISQPNEEDIERLLQKYGGVDGYLENVQRLVDAVPRAH